MRPGGGGVFAVAPGVQVVAAETVDEDHVGCAGLVVTPGNGMKLAHVISLDIQIPLLAGLQSINQ